MNREKEKEKSERDNVCAKERKRERKKEDVHVCAKEKERKKAREIKNGGERE